MIKPSIEKIIDLVKGYWSFDEVDHLEEFKSPGQKSVVHLLADDGHYVLKGYPKSIGEDQIVAYTQSHLFLGNEKALAPGLVPTKNSKNYLEYQGNYYYLMTYIDGRHLLDTPEDEYLLGQALKIVHGLQGYSYTSKVYGHEKLKEMLTWFGDKTFKPSYDKLLKTLPDFNKFDATFIHTDVGPHNSLINAQGKVIFIDLDDSGLGSSYLDLGWPFIMQFVNYNKVSGAMAYKEAAAIAFLEGYYQGQLIPQSDYQNIWHGAVFMHASYMKTYGDEAVEPLWAIMQYGLAWKERLYQAYHEKVAPDTWAIEK